MMLVRMPNTRSGIIVRIERVATTNIDAKKLLAAPACSARCEVSIGSQPILRSECLRDQCSARALIVMSARGFWYMGKKRRFLGDSSSSRPKKFFTSPCSAEQHKPDGGSCRRADDASFRPGDSAVLHTALTTLLRPGTLWDRSRAE